MRLSDKKAKERITSPLNANYIKSAKLHESALRVFTENLEEEELINEFYWQNFNNKLKTRVEKKYARVCEFIRFPLPITQITDSILNDYYEVYEGKNRFFKINSNKDIERLNKWTKDFDLENWIEKESKDVFKNKPCSFVVVDRNEKGEPYLLNIDSNRLIDASIIDEDGNCGYIIFIHSVEKDETNSDNNITYYSVYDSESYRVFKKPNSSDTYEIVINQKHSLGYCPARTFIKTKSNSKNPFKRKVAFTQSISSLEDWTIFDIFRNYTDHYAPFPVTEAPVKKCPNTKCRDGKVSEEEVINRATGESRIKWSDCTACNGGKDNSTLVGPGTHIGIKLHSDKDKEDGSGKFKMHFPETDKMKFIPEKLDDLELEIRYKTVGVSNVLNNEAVNELQVKGSFVSMDSVLLRVKRELDNLYKWICETVGKLIYKNSVINVEANFGTEFYLVSEEKLQERFENAKRIGLPKSEQVLIYKQLIDTKYKGNTNKITRQKLLLDLDPFPLYTNEEIINMYDKGVIDYSELNLKINFYKFITRFELENMNLVEFGENLDLRDKVRIISEQLNIYNNENVKSKQLRASTQGSESV